MKAVDAMLLAIVGLLAAVAFLNFGALGLSSTPGGSSINISYR